MSVRPDFFSQFICTFQWLCVSALFIWSLFRHYSLYIPVYISLCTMFIYQDDFGVERSGWLDAPVKRRCSIVHLLRLLARRAPQSLNNIILRLCRSTRGTGGGRCPRLAGRNRRFQTATGGSAACFVPLAALDFATRGAPMAPFFVLDDCSC